MRATTLRPTRRMRVPIWGLHLLAFAAVWTTLLSSLVTAVDPGIVGIMPTHSHSSLSGLVNPHTHRATGSGTTAACTVETSDSHDGSAPLACGVDTTAGIDALLISPGPVGTLAAAGCLATFVEPLARFAGIVIALLTPPPRG